MSNLKFVLLIFVKAILRYRGVSIPLSSDISFRSTFESPSRIGAYTRFSGELGRFSYIGSGCNIPASKIGRFCSISDNVSLLIGSHPTSDFISTSPAFFSTRRQCGDTFVNRDRYDEIKFVSGSSKHLCVVGNDVWIGANVVIKAGVTIGDGAIVGAGSLVLKDVEPYSIVVGVPSRVIRYRFPSAMIRDLFSFKWWDRDVAWIRSNAELFGSVSKFSELISGADKSSESPISVSTDERSI
jgi:acetyltransferase-like isoleucine patch superfamily enzyme